MGVGVGACVRACVRVLVYSVHYPWVCLYALMYNAESMACVQWLSIHFTFFKYVSVR